MTATAKNTTATTNVQASAVATTLVPREFSPKRGFKTITMEMKDSTITFKPHHQKALILELLQDGPMTLEAMVKKVAEDEKLWTRLQSKQSVFNCISYHMKDLAKLGVIETK